MTLRYSLLCFTLVVLTCFETRAQDVDQLLRDNIADGKKLIEGYISPFMKSVSSGLNQGWYNTAKPHKIAGFDLTFTGSAMTIPTDELFYNVSALGLTSVQLSQNSPDFPNAPTIFGPNRKPVYFPTDAPSETFEGPAGIDLKGELGKNWMPVPMVGLGFGLPMNTDIKIRFIPNVKLGDDGNVRMFGIGVMHDIKQYIPGLKLLPFDLSGFVGYTRLQLDYAYTPDASDQTSEDTRGEFAMNATTIQGLISKKVSVLTVYGGAGYNIARSNIGMLGKWDVNGDGEIQPEEIDPVNLRFAASGPRATVGFRLKLAVFTLHADYTLQRYNALTVGFGINVR